MSDTPAFDPQLPPPGTGLPAYELAWLRGFLRLASMLTPDKVALGQFERESSRIEALVGTVSLEQATVPVLIERVLGIEDSSRCWSVYMVLHHLQIVNTRILRLIELLDQGRPVDYQVRIQDVKPQAGVGPEVLENYLASVTNYVAGVARIGTLGGQWRHPHPWFGAMSAHEWHVLAGYHQWLHRRQIVSIVKTAITGGKVSNAYRPCKPKVQ